MSKLTESLKTIFFTVLTLYFANTFLVFGMVKTSLRLILSFEEGIYKQTIHKIASPI